MSGCAISSAALDALTDPPYWMRTASAVASSVSSRDLAADRGAHGLGVVGGGGPAGADRPDGLVGDHERRDLLVRAAGEPGLDLAEHLRFGLPRLALVERLAAAHDRRHAVRLDRGDLAVHHLVGLAEDLAALGVADDHVDDVELGEERRRHLAGERARVLPVAVLGAEVDLEVLALDHRLDGADVGERRVDADVDRLERRPSATRYDSFWTVWIASKWLRFIFQLPEMSGRRVMAFGLPSRRACQPGEIAVLEELEGGAAAGGDVVDLVVEPELGERRRGVAAADHGEALVSAIAWATVRVPAAKRASSNMPIGPFQNTVRASMITSVNAAAEPGPMSRPFAPSGSRVPNVAYSPRRRRR